MLDYDYDGFLHGYDVRGIHVQRVRMDKIVLGNLDKANRTNET